MYFVAFSFVSFFIVLFESLVRLLVAFFFFKQKTAYEMRISDWSSDVCSSDLRGVACDCASNAARSPATPRSKSDSVGHHSSRAGIRCRSSNGPLDRKSVV